MATIVVYAAYTVDRQAELLNGLLVYTTLFVCAGIFRFLQLIMVTGKTDEPEKIILQDTPMIAIGGMWLVVTLWVLAN